MSKEAETETSALVTVGHTRCPFHGPGLFPAASQKPYMTLAIRPGHAPPTPVLCVAAEGVNLQNSYGDGVTQDLHRSVWACPKSLMLVDAHNTKGCLG